MTLSPYSGVCRLVAITDAITASHAPGHIELLHLLSVGKIKEHEIGGTCRTGRREDKCVHRFVEKREGGRPPGRPSIRWKNNIKMDLKEIR